MILITPLLFLLSHFFAHDKLPEPKPEHAAPKEISYEKGYFAFPLNPGRTTSLSGSFGDIRVNHFHAGLDIRTGGVEGKSIYSAADGYVSRIRVDIGGYGNALYITHPNGLTTVYGHLKEYSKRIKERLTAEQYAQETWRLDLELGPDEIPVKKGELIALSGNTGGSGGPHLHFEIRDAQERTLDPALFGFSEIKDNRAPTIEYITLKCLSKEARINGQFGIFDFPVVLDSRGVYHINQKIKVWGDIGIEMYAYDKAETSPFKLGIKELLVSRNGVSTFNYRLKPMPFNNKIDLNVHTDYKRMVEKNDKLHKGYFELGNTLDFYDYDNNLGIFHFAENGNNEIIAKLNDPFDNWRTLDFSLEALSETNGTVPNSLQSRQKNDAELYESIIKLTVRKSSKPVFLLENNRRKEIKAAYENAVEQTFLIDLNEDFFTHYEYDGQKYPLPVSHWVSPKIPTLLSPTFEVDFGKELYSKIFIEAKDEGQILHLHEDILPLRGRFDVKWQTSLSDIDEEKDKVYLIGGRKPKYVGGQWDGQRILFRPKEFGKYKVLRDSKNPTVQLRSANANNLIFRIDDALSGIKAFECRVNGQWVLMEYEYKNGLLWSEKLDNTPFKGEVELKVWDNCNNLEIYKTKL
ncbi:M23 family metallopeptidase [Marinilongibacter aquaticus]|uniref:M23 family metallopeptidase n=1 Tax=Marinilongibacter aquaticus TaxID=2975157 RepID=UPI0021BD8DDD|nr:M23 family metallopeptidase [Marinilongibacter aquaticus]UBM59374.1 M23 family metallopeptidase [Marinilongibacter aquaticus]